MQPLAAEVREALHAQAIRLPGAQLARAPPTPHPRDLARTQVRVKAHRCVAAQQVTEHLLRH
ncbi:MAG: hypothetical protein V4750_04050, partial [Pseudomonadota bacterium]